MHRKNGKVQKKALKYNGAGKKAQQISTVVKNSVLCARRIYSQEEWLEKKTHRNKRYTIQNAQFPLILCNGLGCFISFFFF